MANTWQRLVNIGRIRMAMRVKCLAMRGNAWHLVDALGIDYAPEGRKPTTARRPLLEDSICLAHSPSLWLPEPCRGCTRALPRGAPEGCARVLPTDAPEGMYQRWLPEGYRYWEPPHALSPPMWAGGVRRRGVPEGAPEGCRCWEPPYALGGLLCGREGCAGGGTP